MGPWRHPIYLIYTSRPFSHMVICSKFELFRIQNCRGSLFFNPSSSNLCSHFNRQNGYAACILISMNGCMYKCHNCLFYLRLRTSSLCFKKWQFYYYQSAMKGTKKWERYCTILGKTFVSLLIFCASIWWQHGNHEHVLLTWTPRARSYVLFYRCIYFCHHKLHDVNIQFVKKELSELHKFSTTKNEYDVHIYWLILQPWLAPLQILG